MSARQNERIARPDIRTGAVWFGDARLEAATIGGATVSPCNRVPVGTVKLFLHVGHWICCPT
ncbi:MAG: hypothetical protein ACXWKH_10555, partial [Limisphaerales bacterium]